MEIEITMPIPVSHNCRPIVHKRYKVVDIEHERRRTIYFIEVDGQRVGVLPHECKVISGDPEDRREE